MKDHNNQMLKSVAALNNLTSFWMVNAFTKERFKGNPAGVFIVEAFPEESFMQSVAAELNWSQTAFVKILSQNDEEKLHAHIRWFSPKDETQICGHATLASAHILFTEGFTKAQHITFDSLAGPLHAILESTGEITLDFPQKPIEACHVPSALKEALTLATGKLADIEEVLKDEAIYVVVLKHAEQLSLLMPDLNKIKSLDTRAISVTAKGPQGFDFQSRYFAPKVGIPEDPVCGSSHARLGPYWAARSQGKNPLKAFQASSRTGELLVTLHNSRVLLTSSAMTVFKAEMGLPARHRLVAR